MRQKNYINDRIRICSATKSKSVTSLTIYNKENTLTVTLINTYSLRQHFDDILSDKQLLYNDIIGLTESQLKGRENTAGLKVKLGKHFRVHFNGDIPLFQT